MSTRHGHEHGGAASAARRTDRARLLIALALAIGTLALEVWGGVVTGSLALLADAGHVLADVGALLLALLALWLASRPHSAQGTYGHHRAEVLAASVNALAVLVISVLLGWEAVLRLQSRPDVQGLGLLAFASAGLAANLVQALALRGASSINTRAARLHVLSDTGGSLVAVAAGIGVQVTGWPVLDPALSLVIVALVLVGAMRMLRETLGILMERSPAGIDPRALTAALLADPAVLAVHELHLWTITTGFDALTAHVEVVPGADAVEVAGRCAERLRADFGIEHATIQPEYARVVGVGEVAEPPGRAGRPPGTAHA